MLKTLRLIATDIRCKAAFCYGSDTPPMLVKVLATDGTVAMILYRLMQAAHRHRRPVLEMLFNKANNLMGGCIIGRGAEFGPGFVLIHSNGVVINGNVRGGSHIYLEHQVTIGADHQQTPVLGSNIFVGAGAKLIGSVQIGDGARIGANAVVVHDVPANTTAVGVPARPVRRRDRAQATTGADPNVEAAHEGEP